MSRTHKTAPWRVRVMVNPAFLEEYHDHTNGVCDLPPRPTETAEPFGGRHLHACDWVASATFWLTPANHCGCPYCGDTEGRYWRNRRRRRAGRQQARYWAKEYE